MRKTRCPKLCPSTVMLLCAWLPFPAYVHLQHAIFTPRTLATLKLSTAPSLSPFYDAEINKLVISRKKDIMRQDQRLGRPRGLLPDLGLSQSFPPQECSAAEIKAPEKRREGDTFQTSETVRPPRRCREI